MSVVASDNLLYNYSFSTNYKTSGRFVQRSLLVEATGQGGLRLSASNATLGKIAFYTAGNNERMRISETGNVGIGTTTAKLQVVGLVEYADDTAAGTAGLTAGVFYHTAGVVKVKL